MPDTEYKATSITNALASPPSTVALRPNTPISFAAQRAVGAAQDAVCSGSRRVVGRWDLSGSPTYHVPASGSETPGGAQELPDIETWRHAATIHVPTITPGCFLQARIVYAPSGNTSRDIVGIGWSPAGPFGAVRLRHAWTTASGSDGPHDVDVVLPVSLLEDAAEPTGAAQGWHVLSYEDTPLLTPDGYDTNAGAAAASEGHTATVDIYLRGAPRVVSIVVYEVPVRTVYDHDDDDPHAVNGQSAYEVPLTARPQTEAANGSTYEEHRFGTYELLRTAERQSELGPVVCELLSWDESSADFTATDRPPLVVSSTTLVDIFDGSAGYEPNRPGMIVAAAHAQQHALCDPGLVLGGVSAVVPVRVVVEGNITGGANEAIVRVQSGPYEWVDVAIDGLTVGTYEATGHLESQVTPDHQRANLQVFAMVDADTVELYSVAVHFGR